MTRQELAKKAVEFVDQNSNSGLSDTQIRKYLEIVQRSECYEEFQVYVKYQVGRENKEPVIRFLESILKYLDDNLKNMQNYREEIAYLFGNMARYKKYVDSKNR
ncbi:MAG TPA: hypothetical protein PLF96_10895, partial [Thermotogota bacterium]|nr:hypothetical protein [Thermotogota bacterium]